VKQLLLDIQPSPSPTLHNFVIGSNSELIMMLNDLADQNHSKHSLTLWGETGSGKTHLLQATVAKFRERGLSAVYTDAPMSYQVDQLQGDLVALDNVDKLDEAAQIALFNLFNRFREQNKLLLMAAPAAPAQLRLREDLKTRMAWGLVYKVANLTDTEKTQALLSHARQRGMRLSEEVVDYCLRHLRRDLPTLMATLDALDDWSLTTKKPVTVAMVREMIQTQPALL
jgi:DnaA family protein